jgi:uncharacterized membrane protein YgcG
MNKNRSIQTILLLGTILAVAMVGIASSNTRAYASNGGYDAGDNNINWKKFKNSNTFEGANTKTQKCFERAHDNGNNLAGYEVKNCEKDSGYGKDGNGDKNNDNGDKKKHYGNKNNDNGDKNNDNGDKKKHYGNKNNDNGDKNNDNGDSGKSGSSGDSGKSGSSGDSGKSGSSGDSGDSGSGNSN